MIKRFAVLLLAMAFWVVSTEAKPKTEKINPRVIHATLAERQRWVIEQAEGPGAWWFSREFEWLLTAKRIESTEARSLAYLFFYSTRTMGGYFEEPVREGAVFRLPFHSELGPVEGFPVFVEAKTGVAWQEGQDDRVDLLSLIRLFAKHRKNKEAPNQQPEPTRGKAPRGSS